MRAWIVAAAVALAAGCGPGIGDPCVTDFDCSITGDRSCDIAQPGGACTIIPCDEGTCPDEATCVRWRPMESRLEFTACMRRCESDGDCRGDQGYRCFAAEEVLDPSGEALAESVDAEPSRFCVATEPEPG